VKSPGRNAGVALLVAIAIVAAGASMIAPNDPGRQFADFSYAPPMPPRIVDAEGRWRRPFVYPLRLTDRLELRFSEDREHPVPIEWFSSGALARVDESAGPWLLLGGDALGRDIFARLVRGARLSLGVSATAAGAALLLGAVVGALAGFRGGRVDDLLMRAADLVLVLPAIYVVVVLRAAMPLVLTTWQVFWTMAVVLAVAGWPHVARGVRAVVAVERSKEYAEAARAIGAGSSRILLRHLLRPGHAAVAGLHSGGSHAVVRRVRLRGTHSKLGSYAERRRPGRHARRSSLAALAGGRHRALRPRPPPRGRTPSFVSNSSER
jgi:peptide/nickel transport system permease protein